MTKSQYSYFYKRSIENKQFKDSPKIKCEHGEFTRHSEKYRIHYLFFHNTLIPDCQTIQKKKESKIGLRKYIEGQAIRKQRVRNRHIIWNQERCLFRTISRNKKIGKPYSNWYNTTSKLARYLNRYHA